MILVNKNFGGPALSSVIGQYFQSLNAVSNTVSYPLGTGTGYNHASYITDWFAGSGNIFPTTASVVPNMWIVTEKFIKTLDKWYTKWYSGAMKVSDGSNAYSSSNRVDVIGSAFFDPNLAYLTNTSYSIVNRINRAITSGVLSASDAIGSNDIRAIQPTRGQINVTVDTTAKLITLDITSPQALSSTINAMAGQAMNGQKLYLFITPYQYEPNYTPDKTWAAMYQSPVGSLWMPTHFAWSLGTPTDRELAIAEGRPVPHLIFDHLDRIEYIDSLQLKIAYSKLQF